MHADFARLSGGTCCLVAALLAEPGIRVGQDGCRGDEPISVEEAKTR